MEGVERAVILAAGRGYRMQRSDREAGTSADQAAVADSGIKALIPIGERTFLDHVLSALADVGVRSVCLVTAPGHDALRRRYAPGSPRRLEIELALQSEPRGTADAVLAAEAYAAGGPFLVLNSDNYLPPESLRPLVALETPGVLALDVEGIVANPDSNITRERMERFALLSLDSRGGLKRILEKPEPEVWAASSKRRLVSVNCWRFDAAIFAACREVEPSERGELELPSAVQYAVDRLAMWFQVVSTSAAVLDLTTRGDVAAVAARLEARPMEW